MGIALNLYFQWETYHGKIVHQERSLGSFFPVGVPSLVKMNKKAGLHIVQRNQHKLYIERRLMNFSRCLR